MLLAVAGSSVMVDLTTSYLGLELRSPLIAGASPLTGDLKSLEALEEAGAGAVVLPSLFEEQIVFDEFSDRFRSRRFRRQDLLKALEDQLQIDDYNAGPWGYLAHVHKAKEKLSIPVIASLNGVSKGGWIDHALMIQEAGADALELNVYYLPTDPKDTPQQVEARYLDLVRAVREAVTIPLAIKLGPYFTSMAHFVRRLGGAGADGVVLFNRFLEPDVDLDKNEVVPRLDLSTAHELGLPLRWVAILREQVELSLAASSGVHDAAGALKLLLCGADTVLLASTLLEQGPQHLATIQAEVESWLDARGHANLADVRGSLCRARNEAAQTFERVNYVQAILAWKKQWGEDKGGNAPPG
jgi:dihydroorotate dehydrogenase (fumarate)